MKVNFSLGKIRNYTSIVEFQSINLQWHRQVMLFSVLCEYYTCSMQYV